MAKPNTLNEYIKSTGLTPYRWLSNMLEEYGTFRGVAEKTGFSRAALYDLASREHFIIVQRVIRNNPKS